ncbi:MAG TPA: hypothetical protein VEH84_00150 [Alphaproteobacteria bacterium]|nr:hypothetical protein [Alphaproteobacteria bacterium]
MIPRLSPATPRPPSHAATAVPFASAEEAWFWFMQAQEARLAGARAAAGLGAVARPCEPLDLLRAVDRLYRQRRLQRDHLEVLAHYGRRRMAPDPFRRRELRACTLWREALTALDPVLRLKGIVS